MRQFLISEPMPCVLDKLQHNTLAKQYKPLLRHVEPTRWMNTDKITVLWINYAAVIFKNVILEIAYFISVNYLIKCFPYLVKHAVFSAIKNMKKQRKQHQTKLCTTWKTYSLTCWDKHDICMLTCWKRTTSEKKWDGLSVFYKSRKIHWQSTWYWSEDGSLLLLALDVCIYTLVQLLC